MTRKTTDELLLKIEGLYAMGSKKPWKTDALASECHDCLEVVDAEGEHVPLYPDDQLIVTVINAAPDLVADVRELARERDALREALITVCDAQERGLDLRTFIRAHRYVANRLGEPYSATRVEDRIAEVQRLRQQDGSEIDK